MCDSGIGGVGAASTDTARNLGQSKHELSDPRMEPRYSGLNNVHPGVMNGRLRVIALRDP